MNEALQLILSLSLAGSILAGMLLIIKLFFKNKISKTVQYYLWLVVVLRLIFPFSFENSIINKVFYTEQATVELANPIDRLSEEMTQEQSITSSLGFSVEKNVQDGVYNNDVDHTRYFRELFSQYILYIWLLGAIIVFGINLIGYIRFIKNLKKANKPAYDSENKILRSLLKRNKVKLIRNPYALTPMLIGILKPYIVIPDIDYTEKQLKNILLHELIHLRRFDIGVKWLTMMASAIHWFNPLMYVIKKEVNYACELSCDEWAIKNLNSEEKQSYGETLISISAQEKYPIGVLQATMCEEKKNLKDRLEAIMKNSKKSKFVIVISIILFSALIYSAGAIGPSIGITRGREIKIVESVIISGYNLSDISKYKTPYIGNASNVMAIVDRLPLPDKYFIQRYISLQTDQMPYGLTVYYEAKDDSQYQGVWPMNEADNLFIEQNLRKNALVLFCMIDNLDEITFAFRTSQSNDKLEQEKYDTPFKYQRAFFKKEYYEDLTALSRDLDLLKSLLVKMSKFEERGIPSINADMEELPDDVATMSLINYNGFEIMAWGNTDPTLDEITVYRFQDTALRFLFAIIEDDLNALKDICTQELYNYLTSSNDNEVKSYYQDLAGSQITGFQSITPPIISYSFENDKLISVVILFNTDTSSRLVHFYLGFTNDLEKPIIDSFAL
ncbi:UNVERIFIED_CONTAM: beta-lactamase regulating signal transducer with metallopeptidase domain [Acetivibrio alkalicellulosi]